VPPRSSSSSSHRRAHHLHLRAAGLITFIFAPPRSSPSSSRRRAHHLHLRAAALITFICAPPPSSPSSSSRRRELLRRHFFICAGSESNHRFAISSFCWQQIQSPCCHFFIRSAGIDCRATIVSVCQHILHVLPIFIAPSQSSSSSSHLAHLNCTVTLFIFFEPSRSSSSRRHDLHLL